MWSRELGAAAVYQTDRKIFAVVRRVEDNFELQEIDPENGETTKTIFIGWCVRKFSYRAPH